MTDRYLASIARGVGVPESDVEDCLQEMKLEVWRSQSPYWRAVVKYRAIDYKRHLSGRTGKSQPRNAPRPEFIALSDGAADYSFEASYEASETLGRIGGLIPYLSPSQRRGLALAMAGKKGRTFTEIKHAANARKRLREWL